MMKSDCLHDPWKNPFAGHFQRLGIWSASGNLDQGRMAIGLERLRQWQMEVIMPPLASKPQRYLAGMDSARVGQLEALLRDERVEALLAMRGGFGVTRILDDLDWEAVRRRNLPAIGYSDFTGFLMAAWKQGCRHLVHGPMLSPDFCRQPETPQEMRAVSASLNSLASCLRGEVEFLPASAKTVVLREGVAQGPLVPANLSLLTALLGTAHWPDLRGCILVLEDVNEATHRIDRMLSQLRSAGILRQLAGMAFGQFTNGEDSEFLSEVLAEYAALVPGPVLTELPFGHVPHTVSLPVGTQASLETAAPPGKQLRRK